MIMMMIKRIGEWNRKRQARKQFCNYSCAKKAWNNDLLKIPLFPNGITPVGMKKFSFKHSCAEQHK
jgi:hypothetical protein